MNELATQKRTLDDKFIAYLESLVKRDDRAALAHLRRGLGKKTGTAMEMFPYISGWTINLSRNHDDAYFLVASLIGLYPTLSWKKEDNLNNLGRSMSFLKTDSESTEKRFTALLNANEEDLANHLQQIVGLLKSKDAPINWLLLLKHIKSWRHEDKFVQRNWAKGFWEKPNMNKVQENTEEKGEQLL
ncbi:MAG: type I-E CRISPR-associated protein Cse2/CasB [Pyrinomonadaceae bacterium]